MSELEPKPPELIQNIEWIRCHGLKYWKVLLVASLVIIGMTVWTFYTSKNKAGFEKSNSGVSNTKEGNEFSAPVIRFTDGTTGTVEFTYEAKVNPDLIIESFKLYGSADAALSSLKNSIYGAAISVLEAKSQEYVRENRSKIASEIIERTKEAQVRTGYHIVEISIGQIK